MFHKILVAMDNSTTSEHVFDEALALAKANDACLMLLHVLSSEEEGSPNMYIFHSMDYHSIVSNKALEIEREQWLTFREHGLELLRSRQAVANAAGVNTEFTQTPGSPGRTICDLARNWGADLIVIGRRGRSGLSELILGSVSNYVLHHTFCSVLTVQHKVKSSTQKCDVHYSKASSV